MKLSKLQKITLISTAIFIFLFAVAFTVIAIATYKPSVAFYNVSTRVQESIKRELESIGKQKKNKKQKYNYIEINSTLPLSQQKKSWKKASLIFATLDFDVKNFALNNKKVKPLSDSILEGMPSTTRHSALVKDNNLYATPLLYDIYELDVHRPSFYETEIEDIYVWDDFKKFLKLSSKQNKAPFTFAGADDIVLIDFIGSIVEAFEGTENFYFLEDEIYKTARSGNIQKTVDLINELCAEGQPFYATLNEIIQMKNENLAEATILSFTQKDTLFYLENRYSNAVFFKHSDHRQINPSVINEFTSIYVPGRTRTEVRTFAAPTTVGLCMKNKADFKTILNLLATSRQDNLSYTSGLAPVQANSAVPDKQAGDVRFWLAASSGPDIPLSGTLPSAEMKNAVAEIFRQKIK